MSARVGTNVAYGRYLEYGAHPKPINGLKLAIPLHRRAKLAYATYGTARKVAVANGLFFVRGKNKKNGNGALVKKKKDGTLEAWFAIVDSTTIRPRPWLVPGMLSGANQRAAGAVMSRVFGTEMRKAIRGALKPVGVGGAV